jgi:hypothetical protein
LSIRTLAIIHFSPGPLPARKADSSLRSGTVRNDKGIMKAGISDCRFQIADFQIETQPACHPERQWMFGGASIHGVEGPQRSS